MVKLKEWKKVVGSEKETEMVEWVCTDHGYRGQYGRRKVHESILVILAA